MTKKTVILKKNHGITEKENLCQTKMEYYGAVV
jgi:hypothetical protein